MESLIVLADLGGYKVYRFTMDDLDESTSIKLVKEEDNRGGHTRQGERATDQAGRFPKGGSGSKNGGMGHGENHNEESESRRKSLESVAAGVGGVLKSESNYDCWHLAAPKTINHQLVELLDAGLRKRLKKNLSLDLKKASKKDLMERFELK